MKKVLVFVAILAAAVACGGAAGSGGGTSYAPAQKAVAGQNGTGTGAAQPSKTGGTAGPAQIVPGTTVPVLQGPPVIRQAQLSMTVGSGSFDSKLSAVRTLVEAQGGYIAGTDAQAQPVSGSQQPSAIRSGTINFMVPAANFDTTIDQLSRIGTVESEHITGTDVSAQYVDLNARLANAMAQRDAMLTLLKQATSINDIIAVQTQIGQITAEIEQLKGQIKYLDDNTSYSSISVSLMEAGAPAQTTSDSWGFATALSDAAHNFVATINYVITGLGAIGPLLVLAGLGYLVWRRRRAPAVQHA
jgi:Domain of unknown function (DUF4349)